MLALLGTSQVSCEWLSSRHAARVANPNRLQANDLRKSSVTGQPPIRLHFARSHLQNARFAYEEEQTLRTLRDDAEVGWTLVVNWASDESQKPAPAAQ
jgi:hypothetical protein